LRPGRQSFTVVMMTLGLCASAVSMARATCTVEEGSNALQAPLMRHLGPGCTEQDRVSKAVTAEAVLSALEHGREIDLSGVIVMGDVSMDRVPPATAASLDSLTSSTRKAWAGEDPRDLRVVTVPISIRDSVVRGSIGTKIKKGAIIFMQALTMTGTTFERTLDFSRSVFVSQVDASDAVFLREAFFIQSVFLGPVRFERTTFGNHSRFHRARFAEAVTFLRSGFNGLAEFLEVSFERDATFSRTHFNMGTGFSGARFGGRLDFSEAVFEREIYFLFSVFEGDASFRRTAFHGQADFSDAEFLGMSDFLNATFGREPQFQRTKSRGPLPTRQSLLLDPRYWYGMAATFLIFAVVVRVLRRRASAAASSTTTY
jgi:Pentapeptide repeats (9 copies)